MIDTDDWELLPQEYNEDDFYDPDIKKIIPVLNDIITDYIKIVGKNDILNTGVIRMCTLPRFFCVPNSESNLMSPCLNLSLGQGVPASRPGPLGHILRVVKLG